MITSSKFTFNKIHKRNTHLLTAINYVRDKIFNGKNRLFVNSPWILCHVKLSFFPFNGCHNCTTLFNTVYAQVLYMFKSAYRILEVCEHFWIRTDYFFEVRWSEGHTIYKISLVNFEFRAYSPRPTHLPLNP